jgi:hypothetical protein
LIHLCLHGLHGEHRQIRIRALDDAPQGMPSVPEAESCARKT